MYDLGVLVSWRSKAWKSITLLNSEAEWVALLVAVKEVMLQLLRSMKISVKHPVTLRVDNVEMIFVKGSISATSDTKYVEMKYKCVNK